MTTKLDSRLARRWAQKTFTKQPDGSRFGLTPSQRGRAASVAFLALLILAAPSFAHASPFDGMINNISDLFTGPIAKAGALIGIIVGFIGWTTGEPGAKRNAAGIAFGVCGLVGAANVYTWLAG